jgi:beta-glucosidase
MSLNKLHLKTEERLMHFPEDFLFGSATASYQVEGAYNENGRTMSIWDTFCRIPGAVRHGHTGDRTCDQYHRYMEDIELMYQAGLQAYRFSLSWSRIFPGGKDVPNQAGFDYYNRLIDALLEKGIRPAITLYHWDLPQELEDKGGWTARDTAERFADYTSACFTTFGDRVDSWITLNEPWCSSHLGYLYGEHAPGIRDRSKAYRAVHHLNLAHGLGVQRFRSMNIKGEIGITLNLSTPRAATGHPEDIHAADRATDGQSRLYMDPIFGRGYPRRHLDIEPAVSMPIQTGDMEIIASPIDFLGLNYYWEEVVSYEGSSPEEYTRVPSHHKKTAMNWDIVPEGLYRQIKWVHENYGPLDLYITENGAAFPDQLDESGNRCRDPERIDYLKKHLQVCKRLCSEGIPLKGYFLWSLLDNFEWAHGYTKRFGIIYTDYGDLRRIPKDSYYFYRDIIAGTEPL